MMSRTLLALALLGFSWSAQAQTLAAPDQLALAELIALAEAHPNPKALVDVAGGHPVALVQGQAMVGFIGRLTVDESDWRDWAEVRPEVSAGACRSGIASFRVDAQHLEALADLPMDLIELASRAVPDLDKSPIWHPRRQRSSWAQPAATFSRRGGAPRGARLGI